MRHLRATGKSLVLSHDVSDYPTVCYSATVELDFKFSSDGLIPAIVQQASDGQMPLAVGS